MQHYSLKKKRLFLMAAPVLAVAVIAGFAIFPLAQKKADYSQIVGQWVRASGGYVLDIKNARSDGKLEAAYLNPKSINISKANASFEAGSIDIFVELRDRYYPGSYYTLTYESQSDRLIGTYHHLGTGQNFNVLFSRKPGAI
ncbi:MAG: hypothetical protein ACYTFK_07345 [Planctomycetota bacterium]|jgi:hypothetical protein